MPNFASLFWKTEENGSLVQLVRIHACHAWGHGFESRTDRQQEFKTRQNRLNITFERFFYFSFTKPHQILSMKR